jgi:small subunit ribosomal protein S2
LASELVRELLDAGIHFGHHASRWNPKMGPFIYGKRNNVHIIDIRETLRGLMRAQKFITQVVANGDDVLFVGTKRQARDAVEEHTRRCGMHFVNERWLGGTLTNARTIRGRLQRLRELEELVESPKWDTGYSKKMKSTLSRELRKIRRNLDGLREMNKLPGVVFIIDVRKEHNAIREARALGIPTIALIDTDSDPDEVSIPIPGNDDAMRGIDLVLKVLTDAVEQAKKSRPIEKEADVEAGPGGRRRGRGRAPEPQPAGAAVAEAPAMATDTAGGETPAS